MIMDLAVLGLFLIAMEIGHRRGLLASVTVLLAVFPLRAASFRIAYWIHDLFLNEFKGLLDFKLKWTESALRGMESAEATHFSKGIRLLTEQPQIRKVVPNEWFEGLGEAFLHTPGGVDRLSDLNLMQIQAFAVFMVLLGMLVAGITWATRYKDWGKVERIGGAAVMSVVMLLLVYQALVMVAPSVWMVPDSPIARLINDSWIVREFFEKNPLMWF